MPNRNCITIHEGGVMLDPLQIDLIVAHTVSVRNSRADYYKKFSSGVHGINRSEKIPEYYPNYDWMIKLYRTVRVHFDQKIVPMELFDSRSPNQTEQERKWLIDNYKLITGPVAMDYVNTVGRCFIQGNFNVSFKEEDEDFVLTDTTYQSYVNENFGPYGSIMNYLRNFLPSIKAQDANGVIAVKPKSIPTTIDEDGNTVVSSVELPEPLPYYYDTSKLVGYKDGVYAMIETTEKSVVTVDGKPQNTGWVYELYDDQWIYRIVQTGVKEDETYETIPWFNHEAAEVPVKKLMGVAGIDDNQIIYQPPFMLSTALLEEAILDNGYLQMIKAKVVFPHVVMLASECEFDLATEEATASCSDGVLKGTYQDGRPYSKTCPKCHGQGMISRMAPFGQMLIKGPDRFDKEGDTAISEPIKFISPPLDAPEMLRAEIDNNISKARGIMHLNTTMGEAKGQENATATAKALDLKNLTAFVAPISSQTWEIGRFVYRNVGIQRYKDAFVMPDVVEPKEFDFKTQSDILSDFEAAAKAGLPSPVMHELLRMYIKSAFHGENNSVKILDLLTKADRILTTDQDAIDMGIARGEIAGWENVLHESGMAFISELISTDKDFLEKPQDVQVKALKDMAVESLNSVKEIKRIELEESVNKDGISDVEAEARAKLKGTVGGVDGIISINQAVFAGEMAEAAGEALLVQIYGFEPEIAASMIEKGSPQEVRDRIKRIQDQS